MIHRPNRYAADCYFCHDKVLEMQGWLRQKTTHTPIEGNFIVTCKACFIANRTKLHPKHVVAFVGEWDMEKSPRKHLYVRA